MKPRPLPLLALGLTLSLVSASPAFAGGKSSEKHVQARAAKAESVEVAEKKAQAREEAVKAGRQPVEEKGWVWTHRPVRHKQTMPAAPKLRDDETK